jgi:hypothetical protein
MDNATVNIILNCEAMPLLLLSNDLIRDAGTAANNWQN